MLNQRKIWTVQEDQALLNICSKNINNIQNQTIKWSFISKLLKHQKTHSQRSGKQCRQRQNHNQLVFRWYNHLNPQINKNIIWTCQQKTKLIELHKQYGNHWSIIATYFKGTTDNLLKNYMHLCLKKGLRLLNLYLCKNRKFKQCKFRNVKQYKQQILTKILIFSNYSSIRQNSQKDYWISTINKNKQEILQEVYQLSSELLKGLMFLQDTYEVENQNLMEKNVYCPVSLFESLIINIHKLNLLCRKKKPKNNKSIGRKISKQQNKSERFNNLQVNCDSNNHDQKYSVFPVLNNLPQENGYNLKIYTNENVNENMLNIENLTIPQKEKQNDCHWPSNLPTKFQDYKLQHINYISSNKRQDVNQPQNENHKTVNLKLQLNQKSKGQQFQNNKNKNLQSQKVKQCQAQNDRLGVQKDVRMKNKGKVTEDSEDNEEQRHLVQKVSIEEEHSDFYIYQEAVDNQLNREYFTTISAEKSFHLERIQTGMFYDQQKDDWNVQYSDQQVI